MSEDLEDIIDMQNRQLHTLFTVIAPDMVEGAERWKKKMDGEK